MQGKLLSGLRFNVYGFVSPGWISGLVLSGLAGEPYAG